MNKNRTTKVAVIVLAAMMAICCTVFLNGDASAKAYSGRDATFDPENFTLNEGDSKTLTVKLSGSLPAEDAPYSINLSTTYGAFSTYELKDMYPGSSATVTYTAPTSDVYHDDNVQLSCCVVNRHNEASNHNHAYAKIERLASVIKPQISPETATIYVGDTQYFSLQNFTGSISSVASTDSNVAAATKQSDSSFTVEGKKEGTAVITVTTGTGATATCSVIVRKIPLTITGGDVYMKKNSTKFHTIKASTNVSGYAAPVNGYKYTPMAPSIAELNGSSTADTLQIKSYNLNGTAPIRVELADSAKDKYELRNDPVYVYVHVQDSDETMIHLSFNPDRTHLGKGDYTYMTIHVDAPQSQYVKITRSDLRTYVKDYNYSHPSTYVYWSQLDAAGNATVLIRPQYSGTSKITVSADGAKDASRTFTITGYPTMPQTGPNYTPAIIAAGLAMLAFCAATVIKMKKKQAE